MTTTRTHDTPIFVVGVARSGTTLLAAMLSSHSRLSCGPETHFFHALDKTPLHELLHPKSWPEQAVEFLFSIHDEKQPVPENFGFNKAEIREYLAGHNPSIQVMLESITRAYMVRQEKVRWVEKTPHHLCFVRLIRQYYPKSPIIRIIRDPRDVALSICAAPWAWAPRTFLGALALWRDCDAGSANFFATDTLSYTVKYEDLLVSPVEELKKICAFLGEEFEFNMLDTSLSYSSVNRLKESWKSKVGSALDTSRIAVWKRKLTKAQIIQSESLIGDRLIRYGYPCKSQLRYYGRVFPKIGVSRYPQSIEWIAENGIRLWPTRRSEKAGVNLYVGNPATDGWLPYGRLQRVSATLGQLFALCCTFILGKPVYWLKQDGDNPTSCGCCATILASLFKRFAVKPTVIWSEKR